jgi:hypothetical protein
VPSARAHVRQSGNRRKRSADQWPTTRGPFRKSFLPSRSGLFHVEQPLQRQQSCGAAAIARYDALFLVLRTGRLPRQQAERACLVQPQLAPFPPDAIVDVINRCIDRDARPEVSMPDLGPSANYRIICEAPTVGEQMDGGCGHAYITGKKHRRTPKLRGDNLQRGGTAKTNGQPAVPSISWQPPDRRFSRGMG